MNANSDRCALRQCRQHHMKNVRLFGKVDGATQKTFQFHGFIATEFVSMRIFLFIILPVLRYQIQKTCLPSNEIIYFRK